VLSQITIFTKSYSLDRTGGPKTPATGTDEEATIEGDKLGEKTLVEGTSDTVVAGGEDAARDREAGQRPMRVPFSRVLTNE
jgi:hypothetical protein